MNLSLCLCPVLVLAFFSSVRTQETCDLEDVDCVTKGAKNIYATLVTGMKDAIEPVDPLFIEKMSGVAETLNYDLTNVTLKGMKDCEVKQLKFIEKESYWQVDLQCPHLFIDFDYKGDGAFGAANINGAGTASVTVDDYLIIFKGQYEQKIYEQDQKPHFFVKSYDIETYMKGKMAVKYEAVTSNADDQTDMAVKFVNENSQAAEKYLHSPAMEKFMALVMERVSAFIKIYPVSQVVPK